MGIHLLVGCGIKCQVWTKKWQHLVVDDYDAMYMTELVRGHEEIHVYVEHPVDDCIIVDKRENVGEGVQPL